MLYKDYLVNETFRLLIEAPKWLIQNTILSSPTVNLRIFLYKRCVSLPPGGAVIEEDEDEDKRRPTRQPPPTPQEDLLQQAEEEEDSHYQIVVSEQNKSLTLSWYIRHPTPSPPLGTVM